MIGLEPAESSLCKRVPRLPGFELDRFNRPSLNRVLGSRVGYWRTLSAGRRDGGVRCNPRCEGTSGRERHTGLIRIRPHYRHFTARYPNWSRVSLSLLRGQQRSASLSRFPSVNIAGEKRRTNTMIRLRPATAGLSPTLTPARQDGVIRPADGGEK